MDQKTEERLVNIFKAELRAAYEDGVSKITEEDYARIYNQGFDDAARCAFAMSQMDDETKRRIFGVADFAVITPTEFKNWEKYLRQKETEEKTYGKWIPDDYDEWYELTGKCPYCGHVTIDMKHYCPNCGAQLKEIEEEEAHE